MARILFTTFGSYGDLHPYMAIGIELQRRGHTVTIATNRIYETKIASEGLGFHPVRPHFSPDDKAAFEGVMDRRRGTELVIRLLSRPIRESYEDSLAAARHADLIVTHPISFGGVLAAQKLAIPWISSVLAPISLLSAWDPPVPSQAPWVIKARAFGPGFMAWLWCIGKWTTMQWVRPIVELRRELALPDAGNPLFEGSHSPRRVLALFSRYLADPQPDWPRQTAVTGFPFFDRHHEQSTPPELARFLDQGEPPVVFTLGTSAVEVAGGFYRDSLEAVRKLGIRAVFLVGSSGQGLPESLPAGMIAVPYAPFSEIFPRARYIVHQGGIGTTAQAMRSGRPMLVVPFAHDQFDNAERVRRLGTAAVLYRYRYNARRAGEALRKLDACQPAAAHLAELIRSENGTAAAADQIELVLK